MGTNNDQPFPHASVSKKTKFSQFREMVLRNKSGMNNNKNNGVLIHFNSNMNTNTNTSTHANTNNNINIININKSEDNL